MTDGTYGERYSYFFHLFFLSPYLKGEELLRAEQASVSKQVGRRRGPNRTGTRGNMANIAVQRIKREFKEVLKSEEVGDHVFHSESWFFLRLNDSNALLVSADH